MSSLLVAVKALAKKETVERLEKSSNNLLKSFESPTFQKIIDGMKSFGVNFAPISGVLDSITATISSDTSDNAIKLADSLYDLITSEGGKAFIDALSHLFNTLINGGAKILEFINNFLNITNDSITLGGKIGILDVLLDKLRSWIKNPIAQQEHDFTGEGGGKPPHAPTTPGGENIKGFQPPGGLK